jgi:hypothetical protein
VQGGDFSAYRGLKFGENLAVTAKQAGARPAEVRIDHQRPALIQELDWQPRSPSGSDPSKPDPVKNGLLYFFNGELFRIAITYDRYKVEGMTADDMIEAISKDFGPASKPTADVPYHSIYGESAKVIARWEDPRYSYDLVATGDRAGFAMILYSKQLSVLANAAIAEAVRLDAQEAPQREIDKQRKQENDERSVLEKARMLNKPNFRL